MSRAAQQVAQDIVDALQQRIAGWQAEISAIDVVRSKQDRKEARYALLQEFIAVAQAEIDKASARIDTVKEARA